MLAWVTRQNPNAILRVAKSISSASMVGIENPEAVHAAWHAQVARTAAQQGGAPAPPTDDAAWFQSGHSRRTEGLRQPLPADPARAASGVEGVVRDGEGAPPPAPLLPAAQEQSTQQPSPVIAVQADKPAAGVVKSGPQVAARQHEEPTVPPPPPPLQIARASQQGFNTRPPPDLNAPIFGSALFDWLGPLLAVLVSVVSVYLWQRSAGIVAERRAPPPKENRYFSPVSRVATVAERLYADIKDLPLVCPHTHVDAAMFADRTFRFASPSQLFVTSDHYVLRMLHSQGVSLDALGVTRKANRSADHHEVNPRDVWRTFAAHQDAFRATPTSLWVREALASSFNITERLTASNADKLYSTIDAALQTEQFRPIALLDAWNIRVLATTNGATDPLAAHVALSRMPSMRGRVIPTFRPDDVCDLRHPEWRARIATLRQLTGLPIDSFDGFLDALLARRAEFKRLGATASDHGLSMPLVAAMAPDKLKALFASALAGKPVSAQEAAAFMSHMVLEHARMSSVDGLVMQIHAGVHRDHHPGMFAAFGPDIGADMPVAVDWTSGLQPLLAELGTHPNMTLVLFTLDESTYTRELAPLAGFYPAVKLGPPWWFLDSLHGMRRYLDAVVDTAGLANLAGFNDDARNVLTLRARHTLWRRAVSDWIATQHVAGVLDWTEALLAARDLALHQAVKTYKLSV